MFNGEGRAVPAAEASRQPAARLSLASHHLSGCPRVCPCPGSARCRLRGALGADVGSGRPGTRAAAGCQCSQAAGPRVAADKGAARQEETGTGAGTCFLEPPSASSRHGWTRRILLHQHRACAHSSPCCEAAKAQFDTPLKPLVPLSEGPAVTPTRCMAPRNSPGRAGRRFREPVLEGEEQTG